MSNSFSSGSTFSPKGSKNGPDVTKNNSEKIKGQLDDENVHKASLTIPNVSYAVVPFPLTVKFRKYNLSIDIYKMEIRQFQFLVFLIKVFCASKRVFLAVMQMAHYTKLKGKDLVSQ